MLPPPDLYCPKCSCWLEHADECFVVLCTTGAGQRTTSGQRYECPECGLTIVYAATGPTITLTAEALARLAQVYPVEGNPGWRGPGAESAPPVGPQREPETCREDNPGDGEESQ